MVVPTNATSCSRLSDADVIHSFSVPSLGFRMDAIPGRLNQTWFKTDREGIYYGQCSRLAARTTTYMPIAIRVVSPEKYAAWLADAKKKFALDDRGKGQGRRRSCDGRSKRNRTSTNFSPLGQNIMAYAATLTTSTTQPSDRLAPVGAVDEP